MKIKKILPLILLSCFTGVYADESAPIQYVQVCSPVGVGYFVTPGQHAGDTSYSCLNPNTGIGATTNDGGASFGYSQSQLLQRISALESQLKTMKERLGIYQAEYGELE